MAPRIILQDRLFRVGIKRRNSLDRRITRFPRVREALLPVIVVPPTPNLLVLRANTAIIIAHPNLNGIGKVVGGHSRMRIAPASQQR